MFVRLCLLCCFCLPLIGQETGLEVDILTSYYDQDGENSPVNGGIGSEELTSASPIFVVRYTARSGWLYSATLGVDNITSASIDAMDNNAPLRQDDDDDEGYEGRLSGASRKDNRAFTVLGAQKKFGLNTVGMTVGFSGEYDYKSIHAGVNWSRDFNQNNTSLSVGMNHYADTLDLYNIDGVVEGTDDRTTTDLSVSLSQVLSSKTVGSVELFTSSQSGFLSSPFQEVILTDGDHVAERLPDSRQRSGLRLSLNHAFTPGAVLRTYYRYYDDDFGVNAHTFELEPHFRLKTRRDTWIYPIMRFHQQDGSDYFGLPNTFSAADPFYTADRDLSTFDSTKLGVGMRFALNGRRMKRFDIRATAYDRDDGLTAYNLSFGLGLDFR